MLWILKTPSYSVLHREPLNEGKSSCLSREKHPISDIKLQFKIIKIYALKKYFSLLFFPCFSNLLIIEIV